MEDLKALTERAECTWDYIDRLRMALASACKERDEVRKQLHEAKSELLKYREAEQAGRLVVLPCKVGATVYGHSKAEVSEYKVAVISLATYNWYLRCQNHNSDFWVTDADIGKTVFLTREEAEAALKGGEG